MTVILHCWWQIIVAAIIYFALGAAWFNPKTFGNAWMKSHGIVRDPEKMKETGMGITMGLSFVCALIFSAAICWICCATSSGECCQSSSLIHCLKIGFLVGMIAASRATCVIPFALAISPNALIINAVSPDHDVPAYNA